MSYEFEWEGFLGSVRDAIESTSNTNTKTDSVADGCVIEIVEKTTFKRWQKKIKSEDLDGVLMTQVSQVGSAIQNALVVTPSAEKRLSIALRDNEPKKSLELKLSFPLSFGSALLVFLMDEVTDDSVSENERQANNEAAEPNKETEDDFHAQIDELSAQICFSKVDEDRLRDEVNSLTAELRAEIAQLKEKIMVGVMVTSRFTACGSDLNIATCGHLVAHTEGESYSTAVIEEKISSGVYFAEFMYLKMNMSFRMCCGVLSSSVTDLDKVMTSLDGGFGFHIASGNARSYGKDFVSTGLPKCNQYSGPVITGILLNADDSTIQFFLNGLASKIFDIPHGEYRFGVSLFFQYDGVKLLKFEKIK